MLVIHSGHCIWRLQCQKWLRKALLTSTMYGRTGWAMHPIGSKQMESFQHTSRPPNNSTLLRISSQRYGYWNARKEPTVINISIFYSPQHQVKQIPDCRLSLLSVLLRACQLPQHLSSGWGVADAAQILSTKVPPHPVCCQLFMIWRSIAGPFYPKIPNHASSLPG